MGLGLGVEDCEPDSRPRLCTRSLSRGAAEGVGPGGCVNTLWGVVGQEGWA